MYPLIFAVLVATIRPSPLPTLGPSLIHATMPAFTQGNSLISVHVNTPFQIRMDATPAGTGYTWQPKEPLPGGLQLLGVFQQRQARALPGGPEREVLVFETPYRGIARLTLVYARPWEHSAPVKAAHFTIRVQ